jgi:tripartite ATP-independent transporter DctM subunit
MDRALGDVKARAIEAAPPARTGEHAQGEGSPRTWFDVPFEAVAAVLMALLVGTVFISTVSRYAFNASVIWSEEIPILLQVWLTFIGGVIALRRGAHVSVDTFLRMLPSASYGLIRAVVDWLTLGLLLVLVWMSATLVRARSGEISPAVGFPMALFMLPLALGALCMAAVVCARLAKAPRRLSGYGLVWTVAIAAVVIMIDRLGAGLVHVVNPLLLLLGSFTVLLALNMPISFCFGVVSIIYLWFVGTGSLSIVAQRLVAGPMSFVLIAVPLFIFAGALMEVGGISRRLVALASAMVGHIRGGLAMVVVMSEILFSGISGSSTADVSAVGSLLIPAMKRAGYKAEEGVAIVAASSAMGILVPPCILMVVLAAVANISVIALFVAGFIPAFVLAAGLFGFIWYKAGREGWPSESKMSARGRLRAAREAIIPLLSPVIVFGGILTGAVTVTEAAVLAVIHALFVGVFVYREVKVKEVYRLFVTSASATSMAFWLIGMASVFSWILAVQQAPDQLGQLVAAAPGGFVTFLLLSILIFVVLGGILDGMPALLILGPVFFPIASSLGIDLVHYGIIIIAAMGIGLFLPALGVGMFIAVGIGRVDMGAAAVRYLPYLVVLLAMLIVVTYVPWITLVLPRLLLGY